MSEEYQNTDKSAIKKRLLLTITIIVVALVILISGFVFVKTNEKQADSEMQADIETADFEKHIDVIEGKGFTGDLIIKMKKQGKN